MPHLIEAYASFLFSLPQLGSKVNGRAYLISAHPAPKLTPFREVGIAIAGKLAYNESKYDLKESRYV